MSQTIRRHSILLVSISLWMLCMPHMLHGAWVVKIGNITVPTEEFQNYINVQKYITGSENKDIDQEGDLSDFLLNRYIEGKLLLIEAQKKGFSLKEKRVQERIRQEKDLWLLKYFVNREIEMPKITVTEEEMKAYLKKINDAQGVSNQYETLNPSQKQQLYRVANLDKYQQVKDVYQKKLEDTYKVKRYKLTSKNVAKVGSQFITQKEFNEYITNSLAKLGMPLAMLKQNQAQYEKIKQQALEELIFNKLATMHMKAMRFETKPIVKTAYKFFQDAVITELYLKEELFQNIQVTDTELEAAFQKHRNQLRRQQWTLDQIEKYLANNIRQEKFERQLRKFITKKKEETVIIRNEKELAKIQ